MSGGSASPGREAWDWSVQPIPDSFQNEEVKGDDEEKVSEDASVNDQLIDVLLLEGPQTVNSMAAKTSISQGSIGVYFIQSGEVFRLVPSYFGLACVWKQ